MSSEVDAEDPEEVVRRILGSAPSDGEFYVLNPPLEYVVAVGTVGDELSDPPTVRLMADRGTLLSVRREFVVASTVADLVESGTLAVREREGEQDSSLIVGGGSVYVPILLDGHGAHAVGDSGSFVVHATRSCEAAWAESEPFDLRTPGTTRLVETMERALGAPAREDFESTLRRAGAVRDDGAFEPVTIALLVAAKHELLHYDVSKWGEDVGLASKATFSRRKRDLEDSGIVTTEKEPQEMGRPRQRLRFTERYEGVLADHDLGKLAARITS